MLERHGLRTGSYTSPHLASFRERIEVGEEPVSDERFAAAVERAAKAAEIVERAQPDDDDLVTQFEALTAAAYHELAASKVEVAVIEAGPGRALRRHQRDPVEGRGADRRRAGAHPLAGARRSRDIAEEKLAVVRDHSTLVTGPLEPAARSVAERVAGERHAHWVESPALVDVPLRAAGAFQRQNFALACAAAEAFLGRALDPGAVADAAAATRIPGRLDPVAERPLVLHDGAHNPAGRAARWRRRCPRSWATAGRACWWPACSRTRTPRPCSERCCGQFDQVVFTRCSNPRSLSPATLESLAGRAGRAARRETVAGARRRGRAAPARWPGPDGAVVVTGSIYLIADLVAARRGAPAPRRCSAVLARPPPVASFREWNAATDPRFGVMIGLVALVVADRDPRVLRDRLPPGQPVPLDA